MQNTNTVHTVPLSVNRNFVNNSMSQIFPCFKEVRRHCLKEQIKGKNNVFSIFPCEHLRVADVLSPLYFFLLFGCLPKVFAAMKCGCTSSVCYWGCERGPEGGWWEMRQPFVRFPVHLYSQFKVTLDKNFPICWTCSWWLRWSDVKLFTS